MAFGKKRDDGEKKSRGGLFGRRHDNDEVEDLEDEPVESASSGKHARSDKPKKRKRNEMLASVLKESVVDTALSAFRENEAFTFEREGQVWHVGWLLDTEDIGGLSKKTNRDEDKGGIIECINAGSIMVFINAALMDQNKLVIIPNAETLDLMAEYSILVHAPYKTCFIETAGKRVVDDDGVEVSYQDAKDVLEGRTTISQLLSSRGSAWGDEAAPEVPTSPVYGYGQDIDDDDEDIEIFDDTNDTEDVKTSSPSATAPIESQAAPAYGSFGDFAEDDFDDIEIDMNETSSYAKEIQRKAQGSQLGREQASEEPAPEPEPEPEPEPVVEETAEDLVERAKRTFFSDDLALGIDYDAFQAHFNAVPTFEPFDTNRPTDSFIGEYMNQLATQANTELASEHQRHIAILYEKFSRMSSSYIDKINHAHSLESDADNRFSREKADAEAAKSEQMLASSERVAIRTRELKDLYSDRRENVIRAATARAAEQFDDRNARALEKQIAHVEQDVAAEINERYNHRLREINRLRRESAAKAMDFGTTAILSALSVTYAEMMQQEHELYEGYRVGMLEWLEDNRRNDVVWSENVAETLRQTERADEVARDYEARLRQQQLDFEQRRQNMEAELSEMRARHEVAMAESKQRQEHLLADVKAENERLHEREKELLDRFSSLDEDKKMVYSNRIEKLEEQLAEKDREYAELMNRDKRSNVLWAALAIVLAIAALCVGMLFGFKQNIDYQMAVAQSSMIIAGMLPPIV